MAERLLTVPEAAELLGVSYRWLWQRTRNGEMPVVALGGRRLVRPADLEEFVAARVTRVGGRTEVRP